MEIKNELFDCFFTYGERIIVEKNKIIFAPDNKLQSDCLYFLESGLVALMSYSRGGRGAGIPLYEGAADHFLHDSANQHYQQSRDHRQCFSQPLGSND